MQTKFCALFAVAILAAGATEPRHALARADDGSLFENAPSAALLPDYCSVDEGDGAFGEVIRKSWRYGVCTTEPFSLDGYRPQPSPYDQGLPLA